MGDKLYVQFTGERVIEDSTPERIWLDHVARYEFASRYVKDKIVLDISCGTGYGSQILCDSGATKVIGVDILSEVIGVAKTKYKRDKLEFKVVNILNIDFPKKFFDVITCFETIEHIVNQEKALMKLQRVLKPNGLLIISSPNRKLTSPLKSISESPDNPFHVIEYTTKEFLYLLKNYFEILEIYGQRGIKKLFLLPFLERITRRILPMIYNPGRGSSELQKVSSKLEYRYISVVCKKLIKDKI